MSQRYVRMHLKPAGRTGRATREHSALFEAWAEGDSREAGQLTQKHVEETRDELSRSLSRRR
jgi:DNA-binding GntR family transcriptional regulator